MKPLIKVLFTLHIVYSMVSWKGRIVELDGWLSPGCWDFCFGMNSGMNFGKGWLGWFHYCLLRVENGDWETLAEKRTR